MSLKYLARQALSLQPHIAIVKSLAYGMRILKSSFHQFVQRHSLSFEPKSEGRLQTFLGELRVDLPLVPISKTLDHQFNLLGSGWVKVAGSADILQISPGNRLRSANIRAMIDFDYSPIDWQLDFKSGYRWREDRISGTLCYGHEPNVDVKVPWELARMQHLPWLGMSGDDLTTKEFRNQVLDFASANPPGYGVNWLCTMDVAIRAANILMAYDLFVAQGIKFDKAFQSELFALIIAHGKHIMNNLEWHDVHRGNHYLANVVGLLFVAAYLPTTKQSDTWLNFAIQELIKEVERQFTSDGANFEASTSYHRLSAELVIYGTALILGMNKEPKLPDWYFERLERMAEFTMHITKPNGRIVQIGDNDSGRLFKLCPLAELDHRATVSAINGLFNRSDLADFAGTKTFFEASVVRTLAKGQKIVSYLKSGESPQAEGISIKENNKNNLSVIADTIIELPDAEVLNGLVTYAYPNFGIYIWRSEVFFLSVRCGPVGQNGNGGHAHNDQLAIELNIEGEDWIADPGTYLYTPSPKDRNIYRSVHAHATPKLGSQEPARLDLGMFRLEDKTHARCFSFGPDEFGGSHMGYGKPCQRSIVFKAGNIRILDKGSVTEQCDAKLITVKDANSLRSLWKLNLSFSPSYGQKD
jgi:hypothetical protein